MSSNPPTNVLSVDDDDNLLEDLDITLNDEDLKELEEYREDSQ
jgi:hypothetical protein